MLGIKKAKYERVVDIVRPTTWLEEKLWILRRIHMTYQRVHIGRLRQNDLRKYWMTWSQKEVKRLQH